jgi:predicted TIM-barrel fold metal-dependent hydrolase
MTMATLERRPQQRVRTGIIDADIHPSMNNAPVDLAPYLDPHWIDHFKTYGSFMRQPIAGNLPYPRLVARADARPPGGGGPGTSLDFMRTDHLDRNTVDIGILQPLLPDAISQRNQDFGAALCTAVNDWQKGAWTAKEPRLRACAMVPQEDSTAAVKEIERRAGDNSFVQIAMVPRSLEPQGRRRYWPIYEAAQHFGLPVGFHVGGYGGHPDSAGGWPSFYLEDHHSISEAMQALLTSLVIEGVFARFPKLNVVLIEGGFTWVPAWCWRVDKHWRRLRSEVPHLKELPSETIKRHVYFTTQPIDEPDNPRHLEETIDWIGWDRLLFSTDYPHWDQDNPRYIFKMPLSEERRQMVFRDNAAKLYGLG